MPEPISVGRRGRYDSVKQGRSVCCAFYLEQSCQMSQPLAGYVCAYWVCTRFFNFSPNDRGRFVSTYFCYDLQPELDLLLSPLLHLVNALRPSGLPLSSYREAADLSPLGCSSLQSQVVRLTVSWITSSLRLTQISNTGIHPSLYGLTALVRFTSSLLPPLQRMLACCFGG